MDASQLEFALEYTDGALRPKVGAMYWLRNLSDNWAAGATLPLKLANRQRKELWASCGEFYVEGVLHRRRTFLLKARKGILALVRYYLNTLEGNRMPTEMKRKLVTEYLARRGEPVIIQGLGLRAVPSAVPDEWTTNCRIRAVNYRAFAFRSLGHEASVLPKSLRQVIFGPSQKVRGKHKQ